MSLKQKRVARSKPDIMWQFAQQLKKEFEAQGQDISVFVNSKLSVNGKHYKPFIDYDVDLASVKWNTFKHSNWILPSKQD